MSCDCETSCRLCGHDQQKLFFSMADMPRWNHRLLDANELLEDRGFFLRVNQCCGCGFVSLSQQLDLDYYDDYMLVPSLSPQAQAFQSDQAHEFVSKFHLERRRVLEIGCGDGFFLSALCKAGAEAMGIEPSRGQCAIARARGLTVEQGLLSLGRRLAAGPFSGFAARQVFEHVNDMRGFLMAIRENLADEAYGMIEVPNLDTLIKDRRFFDFIPEHLNYFTPRTLTAILSLVGFEVLEVCSVDQNESLRAYVKWTVPIEGLSVQEGVAELQKEFEQFLRDCKNRGQRVAVWGAGGKGLSILATVNLSDVDLVIDGDPAKAGKWTPVSHREVFPPDELYKRKIDAIIVTAPAYQFEIARRLRHDMKFNGTIALAGNRFQLFDEKADP